MISKYIKSLFCLCYLFTTFNFVTGQSTESNHMNGGNSNFAFQIFSRLKNKDGNLLISPYSISTIFEIVYRGTKSSSAKQISEAFNFPDNENELDSALNSLNSILKKKKQVVLEVSNSLWLSNSRSFIKKYIKDVITRYDAEAKAVDFEKDPKSAIMKINTWVEEKTKGKISEISIEVEKLTEFILVNVVYFHGTWKYPFDSTKTKEDYFYPNWSQVIGPSIIHGILKPEKSMNQWDSEDVASIKYAPDGIQVKLMYQSNLLNYGEDSSIQWLELPYSDETVSMFIVLPKIDEGIKYIEEIINQDKLEDLRNHSSLTLVDVYLPRFSFRDSPGIIPALQSMGVYDVFDPVKADLTGIVKEKYPNVYIKYVAHNTFIDVNEEGTEAIAVTSVSGVRVGLDESKREVKIFRADHPFIFFIYDKETKNILFIGRVINPN